MRFSKYTKTALAAAEAGAVSDYKGSKDFISKDTLLASNNNIIHEKVLRILE